MGKNMSNGGEEPAAGLDWLAVRQDWMRRQLRIGEICTRYGITPQELAARRKAEGWKRRTAKSLSTAGAIARLKDLLHRRLADLENQLAAIGADVSAAAGEREIKSINTLVRTLEKVLELERRHKSRAGGKRGALRIVDTARRLELARRIEALSETWGDAPPDSASGGS
jgi:hypothetical protein